MTDSDITEVVERMRANMEGGRSADCGISPKDTLSLLALISHQGAEIKRLEAENAEALRTVEGLAWLSEKVTQLIDPSGVLDVRGLKEMASTAHTRAEAAEALLRSRDEEIGRLEAERAEQWRIARDRGSSLDVLRAANATLRDERQAAEVLLCRCVKAASNVPHRDGAGLQITMHPAFEDASNWLRDHPLSAALSAVVGSLEGRPTPVGCGASAPSDPPISDGRDLDCAGLTVAQAEERRAALSPEAAKVSRLVEACMNAEAAFEMLGFKPATGDDFRPVGVGGLMEVQAVLAEHPEHVALIETATAQACESCGMPASLFDEEGVGTCRNCAGPPISDGGRDV